MVLSNQRSHCLSATQLQATYKGAQKPAHRLVFRSLSMCCLGPKNLRKHRNLDKTFWRNCDRTERFPVGQPSVIAVRCYRYSSNVMRGLH
jgi:hypothetical protein